MKLFEKLRVHFGNPDIKQRFVCVCGRPVIKYGRQQGRKYFTFSTSGRLDALKPVFYLKINRLADYTLPCIQHWVNIIGSDANIVFVCDNPTLQHDVLKYIAFPSENYSFIPSLRRLTRPISKWIGTKWWKKATDAHLTTFIHAELNKVNSYWAIDADDTMILQSPEAVKAMLCQVETYAKMKRVDIFSLDMWRSRTKGQHWSLGIVYVNDNKKVLDCARANRSLDWIESFKHLDVAFNFDWFVNYLNNNHFISAKTFYFESYYFIHWGNFLRNCIGSSICYWSEGNIYFPVMRDVFQCEDLGVLPIADCVKFSDESTLEDGLHFLVNEVPNTHFFSKEIKHLHGTEDFGANTKFFY